MPKASFVCLLLWHCTEVQYKLTTNQGRSLFHTHQKPLLGGNSASAQHAPLGHIDANQHIPSGQQPQTPAVYKEMNKWKTPTQAKVRVKRREAKF